MLSQRPGQTTTTKLSSSSASPPSCQLPTPSFPAVPPTIHPAVATVCWTGHIGSIRTTPPTTRQRLCQGGGREITPSGQLARL